MTVVRCSAVYERLPLPSWCARCLAAPPSASLASEPLARADMAPRNCCVYVWRRSRRGMAWTAVPGAVHGGEAGRGGMRASGDVAGGMIGVELMIVSRLQSRREGPERHNLRRTR